MPDHVIVSLPERRSDAAPAGIVVRPAASTLTATERDALRELRRRYEIAAAHITDALSSNRLDFAHDCLGQLAAETDGLALAAAARLGK